MCLTTLRTLIQAEVPTVNGRIYTREMLEAISTMSFPEFGMLGTKPKISTEIEIEKISHQNLRMFIDDEGYLSVDIKLMNTPMGEIAKQLILSKNVFINIIFLVNDIDHRNIIRIVGLPIDLIYDVEDTCKKEL